MKTKLKLAVEVIAFGLNISAAQLIYIDLIASDFSDENSAQEFYEAQRIRWRYRALIFGFVVGLTGYLLRPYAALVGPFVFYVGVLIICMQLTTRWAPAPFESAKKLLSSASKPPG